MRFPKVTSRLNEFLYKRSIFQLGKKDVDLANRWTFQLIRDSHPRWNEHQVQDYYAGLSRIKVLAVDEWEKKFGVERFL